MTAENGFAKALGISVAVVSTYLFLLKALISVLARACKSDKMRRSLAIVLCFVIPGLLLSCFAAKAFITYYGVSCHMPHNNIN